MEFIDKAKSYGIAKAPDLMLGGSIVGLGFTIGLSVKAGMEISRAKDIYDHNIYLIENAEHLRDSGMIDPETPYPPEDAEADRKEAKRDYIASVAKALAQPIGAGVATAALTVGAVGNANAKYAKAAAVAESLALSVNKMSKFIKDYRNRVIDEEGMLKDLHYALGIPEKEIVVSEVDEQTGKKVKKKKQVLDISSPEDVDVNSLSPYQLIWGPYKMNGQPNHNFYSNKNLDTMFLSAIEGNCDSKLQRKGYLKISDIYEELNENDRGEMLNLGWIKNFRDPVANAKFGVRDGHVNFRITPIDCGGLTIYLLDFNSEGVITDKIDDAVKQNALEIGVVVKR